MRSMTDDERAIRELVSTWMAASKAGDTDTVLSLMADDVIFMVPGREPFGKEAFAAAAQGMGDISIEGASEIQELQVLGDWAYIRNRLTLTVFAEPRPTAAAPFGLYAVDPAQGEGRALAARARCEPARGSRIVLLDCRHSDIARGLDCGMAKHLVTLCLALLVAAAATGKS